MPGGPLLGDGIPHASLGAIPGNGLRRRWIVMEPLASLDDLVDPSLIDAKLEGDFLLGHLRRCVKLQDLPGKFRGHLLSGNTPCGRDRAFYPISLPQLLENSESHVHSLFA